MKNTPFMKIKDACAYTGLSQFYLRNGCKDGSIPHVRSGQTYFINVPALLRQLGADNGTIENPVPIVQHRNGTGEAGTACGSLDFQAR